MGKHCLLACTQNTIGGRSSKKLGGCSTSDHMHVSGVGRNGEAPPGSKTKSFQSLGQNYGWAPAP